MGIPTALVALGATALVTLAAFIFGDILIFALAPIIGSWLVAVLIVWGVCAVIFGVTAVFAAWSLRRANYSKYLEENQSSLTWSPPRILDAEHSQSGLAWADKELPKYCTPVEILNEYHFHDGPATSAESTPTAIATIAKSKSDDFTFGTSPFTSPPVFAMEIFISKEEVVVHEEVVPASPPQEASALADIDEPENERAAPPVPVVTFVT
jgi:hypothetical protein